MSAAKEEPVAHRAPAKICPKCVGEPIKDTETCPRCDTELVLPTQQHQRNVQRAFNPDPPNSTTHTF